MCDARVGKAHPAFTCRDCHSDFHLQICCLTSRPPVFRICFLDSTSHTKMSSKLFPQLLKKRHLDAAESKALVEYTASTENARAAEIWLMRQLDTHNDAIERYTGAAPYDPVLASRCWQRERLRFQRRPRTCEDPADLTRIPSCAASCILLFT